MTFFDPGLDHFFDLTCGPRIGEPAHSATKSVKPLEQVRTEGYETAAPSGKTEKEMGR